jgi:uncharacterized protein (TIGR03435 family)
MPAARNRRPAPAGISCKRSGNKSALGLVPVCQQEETLSRKTLTLVVLASGAALAQPAAPGFDVASIRASQGGKGSGIETRPGSLTTRNVPLSLCIQWAYQIQPYQISGPGWIDDARFDILAKAGASVPDAELRRMMQALLADRFKLVIHRETKEMPALILTLVNRPHKLQPAEKEGPGSFQSGKMRLTGQGATLGQLTEFLSREVHVPVIDETGLSGRFNYSLDINAYVTEEMQKSPGIPIEAPSIIKDAIQAQLGLKVESRKAPIEVLIVDHVERTPAEN